MNSLIDVVKSITEKENDVTISPFYKEYLRMNSEYNALIQKGITQKRESRKISFPDDFKRRIERSYYKSNAT